MVLPEQLIGDKASPALVCYHVNMAFKDSLGNLMASAAVSDSHGKGHCSFSVPERAGCEQALFAEDQVLKGIWCSTVVGPRDDSV